MSRGLIYIFITHFNCPRVLKKKILTAHKVAFIGIKASSFIEEPKVSWGPDRDIQLSKSRTGLLGCKRWFLQLREKGCNCRGRQLQGFVCTSILWMCCFLLAQSRVGKEIHYFHFQTGRQRCFTDSLTPCCESEMQEENSTHEAMQKTGWKKERRSQQHLTPAAQILEYIIFLIFKNCCTRQFIWLVFH